MLHIFPMSLHAQDFSWHFISPSWHPTLYPSGGQDKYDPQFDLCGHHFSQSVVNKQTNKPTSIHNNQCRHTINICWLKQWKEEISPPLSMNPPCQESCSLRWKGRLCKSCPSFCRAFPGFSFYIPGVTELSANRGLSASQPPTCQRWFHKNLFLLLVVAKV